MIMGRYMVNHVTCMTETTLAVMGPFNTLRLRQNG